MRTKNASPITAAESAHMRRVKSVACVLCDAPPPSAAHHQIQGLHFTTIALCLPCHQGPMGVHGDKTMLRLKYGTADDRAEQRALNETLRRIAALTD